MKRHLPLQTHIIWCAIALGLFGGFGMGAHLVYYLAFGLPPGKAFGAMIQVHGHLQLLGWTGLFIIGVSLFKLPRLMSTRPLSKILVRLITISIVFGITLKSTAHILLFYLRYEDTLRMAVAFGGLLESTGILLFFSAIFRNSVTFRPQTGAYAAASIKPFLMISLIAWLFYALINAFLGVEFYRSMATLQSPAWNEVGTETYIHGVLLPTCFAFSISTFPIFLRLRAPTWPVLRVATLYGLGAVFYLLGTAVELVNASDSTNPVRVVGVCLRAAAIVYLIVELDFLRLRMPWYRKFRSKQDRENRPPRRHAGDYGQYGNFEWLIYSAYAWLLLGVVSEVLSLVINSPLPSSAVRHFYLLGFVTHLILGMAVRLVPGFLGSSRIAFPFLVRLSFALILLSTITRTFPVLVPSSNHGLLRIGYGFSGVIAMAAIALLGVNLFATVRRA